MHIIIFLFFIMVLYFYIYSFMKSESVTHSVLSNSLQPHGLWPARLLCPWDSPGKITGVG